jgi:hypothetical protein
MPEAFCPEWGDGVYAALIDIEKISDEKTKTKKTQIFLSRLTSEELNAFASMLESYMRDMDTAKLLRQEYKRRKELEDRLKEERAQSKFRQQEKVTKLTADLLDGDSASEQSDYIELPYEYVILDIDEKRSEQKKNEFRGELTNLSDAQLFILKQIAIEEKNSEAIKIIEEERPGDLSKALE